MLNILKVNSRIGHSFRFPHKVLNSSSAVIGRIFPTLGGLAPGASTVEAVDPQDLVIFCTHFDVRSPDALS